MLFNNIKQRRFLYLFRTIRYFFSVFSFFFPCFSSTFSLFSLCFSSVFSLFCSLFFLFSCATGVMCISSIIGVSIAAVVKCTKLFASAVNKLASCCIVWPTAGRRQELSNWAWERYGFRGCIGSVEGTTVPLAYAPRVQPWTWWDRHGRNSVHALFTCDHHRNIISISTGFTSAANDAMVQKYADWHRFPEEQFSLIEYLLCDKGIHRTARVAGPLKRAAGETRRNTNSNWQLARLRVIAEHTIGVMKASWTSLRELRLPIGSNRDLLFAMDWTSACSVLHNACSAVGDAELGTVPEVGAEEDAIAVEEEANECRSRVKSDVLAFMGRGHGAVQVMMDEAGAVMQCTYVFSYPVKQRSRNAYCRVASTKS